jgi:hypothetical protein
MRCTLIEAEKANYPIAWMCRQVGVPRSSFYAWRTQADTVTATAARRRVLAKLVGKVFDDSRGTYGCRRVAAELNRRGHPASVGLVADLMRELGPGRLPATQLQDHHRRRRGPDDQPGPD